MPVQTTPTPFPIRSLRTTVEVSKHKTDITSHFFSDKILLTVTQSGRLAHWIHVPLSGGLLPETPAITESHDPDLPPSNLLPSAHLTATTILGGTHASSDTLGQLLATQVASAICVKDEQERRMLVLGLGLDRDFATGLGRQGFEELVGGCLDVL